MSHDLSAKNPNGRGEIKHKSPEELISKILQKETQSAKIISEIRKDLNSYDKKRVD